MPRLSVEPGGGKDAGPHAVRLVIHDPRLLSRLEAFIASGALPQAVLRVEVAYGDGSGDGALPPVAGHHSLTGNGIRFTPHFPFEPGLPYRASFDPAPLGHPGSGGVLKLDFSRPAAWSAGAPAVEHIFPSADELPENLLRFYVCFSQPMRRGRAGMEVSLLDAAGRPLRDVLYRAPVELWDPGMRCLTVLLDPGRLKREVGPNRALGPPLRAGEAYALAVGAGMTGFSGSGLPRTVLKRFRAAAPMREPLATDGWRVVPPAAGSHDPLVLRFARPLDWALLRQAVTVTVVGGQTVAGRVDTGMDETEARFTPAAPWASEPHLAAVSPQLEDVCGNDLDGAFDRPLRSRTAAATPPAFHFRPL